MILKELRKKLRDYNKKIKSLEENSNQERVEMFLGKNGLLKFISQTLNTKKITTFGAEGVLEKDYPHIWKIWIRKLQENNISFSVIYNEKSRELRELEKIPFMKVKYIDRDFLVNVTTQIMDEQINIFHWKENPLIVVIKSKEIARAYREEFNSMWTKAKA